MKGLSKKERTRITIMHAAKGLFEQHGLERVTFNDIAETSGVCRTTVFNHFSDTSELMLSITKQETDDAVSYIAGSGLKGAELAITLFEKLLSDACKYPKLTGQLINNAILSSSDSNPILEIERVTLAALEEHYSPEEARNIFLLISGAYYGILNHYHVNNKEFDEELMTKEFRSLVSIILK